MGKLTFIADRVPRENDKRREFVAGLTTSYLSEAFVARTIFDLWDGKNNLEIWNNPTEVEDYNDDGSDTVCLTFGQIFSPIWNRGSFEINNIDDYFVLLKESLPCYYKRPIKELFLFNQSDRPTNITPGFLGNTEHFPEFGTDVFGIGNRIFTEKGIKSTNKNLWFDGIWHTVRVEEEIDNSFNSLSDLISINSSSARFNFWNNNQSIEITDPVTVNSSQLVFDRKSAIGLMANNSFAPNTFSSISANVCNSEIIINGGEFRIGATDGTINTTMLFEKNSLLSVGPSSSEAKLIIEDNSKVIIDENSTLLVAANSKIILNGDNAILEIRGRLIVNNGVNFTFEGGQLGSGHIVFNTKNKNNILLGNNSKIHFVGSGSSDRVMEVMADYIFWPDKIQPNGNINSSLEIQNGLVALGNNAILNIGVDVTLNNVRFYAEPTSKAKGIVLWGNKHTINNVTLENVYGGIQSFNTVGGHQLTMAHVTVSGANAALLSDGKGCYLNDFESDNNNWGIHINGSHWPNKLYAPVVKGADMGTMYSGGFASSNLLIHKPDYSDNLYGVDFTGSGNLVLDCGRFHASTGGAGFDGIKQKGGGNLVVADALGYLGGRVSFANAAKTIVLNKTKFYLDKGYNDLRFYGGSSNMALSGHSHHVASTVSGIIKADYNLWDSSNNTPTTLCLQPPGGYQNYNITCLYRPFSTILSLTCVTIPTTPVISTTQFASEQTNRCINGSTTTDKGTKTTGHMITTTHFNNTNLQDAVGTILDNIHNTAVPDYGEVIDYWAEILTEVSYVTPYSEEDYYYIDLAESKMMEALGLLLSNDTTLELSESGQSHFVAVLDVQDTWIELLDEDTTDAGKELKNIFHFDKGAVYHLEGENSLAQSQWLAMQLWANQQYLDHTDFWLCRLVRENALKNCGNNPDSIANIPECQYSEGENQFVMKDPTLFIKEDNKISKRLTIYPNPASTLVTVELETNKNETATITMYSIDGKCVKTLPRNKLHSGVNSLNIPILDIAPGIYIIAIESETIKWSDKVIIE